MATVYRYTHYDIKSDQTTVRPREATLEAITFAGLTPIMDSAREADQAELGADGFVLGLSCPKCSRTIQDFEQTTFAVQEEGRAVQNRVGRRCPHCKQVIDVQF